MARILLIVIRWLNWRLNPPSLALCTIVVSSEPMQLLFIFYIIKWNFLYVYMYVCLYVPKYLEKYRTYSFKTNT